MRDPFAEELELPGLPQRAGPRRFEREILSPLTIIICLERLANRY